MRARDHDAAVEALGKGGVVDFFRSAEADAHHVHTGGTEALGKGGVERRAGEAGVVPDDHTLRLEFLRKGVADVPRQLLIQRGRIAPTYVVGLEAGKIHFSPMPSRP